jgi:hypothetical protein
MKTKKIGYLIGLGLLAMVACDYIPDLGTTSNLPGTWDFTYYSYQSYENGILDTLGSDVEEDLGTFTFVDDGSGSYSFDDPDGTTRSGTFDWVEDNDKLYMNLLTFADSVTTNNLAIAWDVETNTATNQVWTAEITVIQEGDEATTTTRNEYEVRLEKQ